MVLSRLYVRRRGNGYRRARVRGWGGGAQIWVPAGHLWYRCTTAARDGSFPQYLWQDPAPDASPRGGPQGIGQGIGRGSFGDRRQTFRGQTWRPEARRGGAAAREAGLGVPPRADRGDRDRALDSGYPRAGRLRR